MWIYIYIKLNHFAVHLKHNTVNQLGFNKVFLKIKNKQMLIEP